MAKRAYKRAQIVVEPCVRGSELGIRVTCQQRSKVFRMDAALDVIWRWACLMEAQHAAGVRSSVHDPLIEWAGHPRTVI